MPTAPSPTPTPTPPAPPTPAVVSTNVPMWVRIPAGGISGPILVSALGGCVEALFLQEKVAWSLLGFEAVILVAGVIGVLLGLGRFRRGPALALVCVAGTVLVGTGLGRLSVLANPRAVLVDPWFVTRLLASLALAALATLCVFSRSPVKSWRSFLWSVVLGVPVLMMLGVVWKGRRLLAPLDSAPEAVRVAVALLGFILFIVLASASVHKLIRAFEFGRFTGSDPTSPGKSDTPVTNA